MTASYGTLLLAVLLLPFAGSCVAAMFRANARNTEALLAGIIALIDLLLVAAFYPNIAAGEVIAQQQAWIPELGLNFALRLDGFAWLFAILIAGMGVLVVLYARYYMAATDRVPRFFSLLLAFEGAMLGIVMSGNLIQLTFFWELTSLFSCLLIGYWHRNAPAREGARIAVIVTSAGGLCLFAGVLLLGHMARSYDLDKVLAAGEAIRTNRLYVLTLVLILIGAFSKSAQFPFQFWLPQAMAAPAPVSAYLHSATMVKAGVFLLVRLWPVLGGTNEWLWFVGSTGLVTFILGAFFAVFQQDLKGLLAYSTISHLGLITLLSGLDTPFGQIAAIFHIMNHGIFKASLFMAAGIIDHETGTRDMRRLSGLLPFMPLTATLAMVAAAAMAGVPLLNGFLSKEMFFAETIQIHDNSLIDRALPYIVTVASMFTVAYSLRFIHDVFFGPPPGDLPRVPHEAPRWMRFPVELLVLACLIVGIVPSFTVGPALDAAVRSVLGPSPPAYSLAVWHGFTPEFFMSMIALTGGTLFYVRFHPYLFGSDGPPVLGRLSGYRIFDRALVFLSWRLARRLEILLSTRRLQPQLQIVVVSALIAGLAPLYSRGVAGNSLHAGSDAGFLLLWAVGIACAVGAAYQAKYHRFAALVSLSGAGLITCVSFVWLSAPDLALTQLVVEAVTTVLLLLGLRWLPKRLEELAPAAGCPLPWHRVRDFGLAVAVGSGLGTLSFLVMTRSPPETISRYFVENAYAEGGGTNVVNVILVDFRAFDTFGEITVLAVVALTVFALLRRFRPSPESIPAPEQQRAEDASGREQQDRVLADLEIPALIMRLMFPALSAVALYLLLRGHDHPGGGFVAGVTMAVALILNYMARGTLWAEARLRILPVRWMGIGLLLVAATGIAAWLFARPFLTSFFGYADIPVLGSVPLASALVFDLGVFAVVLGATVLILISIAHQSLRSHRTPRLQRPAPARHDAGVE